MSGHKASTYGNSNCPCNTPPGGTQQIRPFIGSNYSGNPNSTATQILYTKYPLWDGIGCGTHETICCSAPGLLPWFHRDYGNVTTTDYIIELRVCASYNDEDVPVSFNL